MTEQSKPSSDVSALARLIELPATPQRVIWETVSLSSGSAPGPSDWALVAVLDYDEAAVNDIFGRSRVTSPSRGMRIPQHFVREWFPSRLKQQLEADREGRAFTLTTSTYDPSVFSKSPLLNGYMSRLDAAPGQIFLVLYTM